MAVALAGPYASNLQTDNHTNTPSLAFYKSDALPDAHPTMSSTEGIRLIWLKYMGNWHIVYACITEEPSEHTFRPCCLKGNAFVDED